MKSISLMPKLLQLPEQSGCYIVRARGIVLYVGMSTNIRRRWVKDGHNYLKFIDEHFPDAEFETILCGVDDLKQTEKNLIRWYKPILNGGNLWSVEYELGVRKPHKGWKSKGLLKPRPNPSRYRIYDDE